MCDGERNTQTDRQSMYEHMYVYICIWSGRRVMSFLYYFKVDHKVMAILVQINYLKDSTNNNNNFGHKEIVSFCPQSNKCKESMNWNDLTIEW